MQKLGLQSKSQMKEYFVKAQEPQYLDKLLTVTDKSFSEIIRIREMFEDCLKNSSLDSQQTTQKNAQSGGALENKKVVMAAQPSENVSSYQTFAHPLHLTHKLQHPLLTTNAIPSSTIPNTHSLPNAPTILKPFLSYIQCPTNPCPNNPTCSHPRCQACCSQRQLRKKAIYTHSRTDSSII